MKLAGADPVFAIFVFLYLLKRDAEPFAKRSLGHLNERALQAYS
jgi:hypothetical protein